MDKDDNKTPVSEGQATKAYRRALDRLTERLEKAEERSWELIQQQIEDAVEIELTAQEMTRDEVDLLKAYLTRDLKQLGYYAHETGEGIAAWLNFDLNILESELVSRLIALADQTRVDQERLREQLANDNDEYMAGEIAAMGTMECQQCKAQEQLLDISLLTPCSSCGGTLFRRVSDTWVG